MIAVLVLLALGCNNTKAECSETVACGFGETCVEGVCKAEACATSAQCDMEAYCKSGACVSGCQDDADCYPGDACDSETSACVAATCTETRADCAFGEFCNSVTGDCYDAGGYYCHTCVNDSDCGGNDNLCLNLGYSGANFCGVTCQYEADCPAGYTCSGISDLSGNIIAYQCITYCWLYEDARSQPPIPTGSIRHVGPL